MERNEVLVFSGDVISDFPTMPATGLPADYLRDLRRICSDQIPCRRVCATLLDHRLGFSWDDDCPGSLMFPMVRTGRQFRGKFALRGVPRDISRQLWCLHRLCLGTFLPPSEMDEPDLHRVLCGFPPYRGHISGQALLDLEKATMPNSYFSLLSAAADGTEKQGDVDTVVGLFRDLIAAVEAGGHATSAYVLLGVD